MDMFTLIMEVEDEHEQEARDRDTSLAERFGYSGHQSSECNMPGLQEMYIRQDVDGEGRNKAHSIYLLRL